MLNSMNNKCPDDKDYIVVYYDNIFRDYYTQIVFFVNSYVNNYEISKELTQDVFLSLWERRFEIEPNNLKSYIYTIARNKSLNYLKHQIAVNKHKNSLTTITNKLNLIALQSDSMDSIFISELQIKLKDVIENLPDKCKQIFKLSRYENLKNKEIAQKLDVSLKTVEAQITKALKILKSELYEYSEIISIFFLGLISF